MRNLRISATSHALNYLPQYFASAEGLFGDRGITVDTVACDPWTGVLDDLATGRADIALGGIWVPAMYFGSTTEFTVFGQVNHQFPKALVTREPVSDFSWRSLDGATILAPGIGGSAPYAFTAGLMREAGVDPRKATFIRDLSTPMLLELFLSGLGDAIVLDLRTALSVERAGDGFIAADYTVVGGIGPNSVYYTRKDRSDELADAAAAFIDGLGAAMDILAVTPVERLAPLLTSHWPDAHLDELSEACSRHQQSRTWETPVIDADATDRWMSILHAERMIKSPVRYSDLVTEVGNCAGKTVNSEKATAGY